MLDIKFIRENPSLVQKAAVNKGVTVDIDHLLAIDQRHRELMHDVQVLREERNALNDQIKMNPNQWDKEGAQALKQKLERKAHDLKAVGDELLEWLLKIPNLPKADVPIGDESQNKVIKQVGKPTSFDFQVRDHVQLGEILDIIDIPRASKVSGTRFAYLKNDAVLLEFALVQYALGKLIQEGFIPIIPPALIKKEITDGLGYWSAGGNENYYFVRDYEVAEKGEGQPLDLYLVGTGEHVAVSMHAGELFRVTELPKKYVIFSPCFRREAGSYGRDTRGIFRVHQFDKVEMVAFVKPEDDEKERRKMLALAEDFLSALNLPYQLVKLASGDLGFPTAETTDIETWIPSQNKYRETHSVSTTTDFRARRLNIKYLPSGKAGQDGQEKKYVHILNGTAFAIGRTIIAILENYQQEDGSVVIPEVLHKYIGKSVIKPQKHS